MGAGPSAKLPQAPGTAKRRQQVAAVCYRIRKRSIEFLLVQTRGGRWIFPKGGVEAGLTHAQSAALEAFEEAGVHGRMEEIPFARYYRRRPETAVAARSFEPELAVSAHLCEVSRLELPQEINRNPTWFSAEKAKLRLCEHRAPEFGGELARIVDRACLRIERLRARNGPDPTRKDALHKVHFEALEDPRFQDARVGAALGRYFLGRRDARTIKAFGVEIRRPVLRLGAGARSPAEIARNVTAIDSRGKKALAKRGA